MIATLSAILLLVELGSSTTISCATNCKTCWGALATECMSCESTHFLDDFQCVATGGSCRSGYDLDPNDNRCKRTITDTQSPC